MYKMSVMHNLNNALAQQNENIDLQTHDNHGATFNETPENEIHLTTTFAGEEQHSSNTYSAIEDPTFDASYMADYDIDKFLSRPVKVATYTMTQGSNNFQTYNIWNLYFNTPQIKKKLDNYFLINCNMKVKFVINSTPFMYGAVLASYEPLTAFSADNVGVGVNTAASVLRSQRPHLWLYPQTNQGGEMTLPFYYYQEWLNINSATDVSNFGTLTLEDIVALRSASGATSQTVTIQIWAWAENVKLAGPTYSLALQNDEYTMNGPVSTIASSVSTLTSKFESMPVIGKYFKATSVFSGGLAKAASILGFTNTPVIDPVQPMYIQTVPPFASSEISFPEQKLTYDPKNELTVDPRVVGLNGVDEMDITNIVQRESYLTQFTWSSSSAPETSLFNMVIHPSQKRVTNITANQEFISATPMSHISNLFQFWRGDIIVRFRFICSQYHRGRVRITWDPNGDIISTSDNYPTSINTIVDIAETTDVEMRIPYMQPQSWCRNSQVNSYSQEWFNRGAFRSVGFDNGTLTVRVFNNQTSQVSSADIFVLVSVRGAENLEFANPTRLSQNLNYFQIQNNEYALESPTQLGVESTVVDERYSIYMGECIKSLRTILRRRNFYRLAPQWWPGDISTSDYAEVQCLAPRLPVFPGYDPLGFEQARNAGGTGNANYNWVANTPYQWLAGCYLGCRGSINWYFVPIDGYQKIQTISLTRTITSTDTSSYYAGRTFTNPVSFGPNAFSRYGVITTADGLSNYGVGTTVTSTSSSLGAQVPFYSAYRMRNCDSTAAARGRNLDGSSTDTMLVSTVVYEPTSFQGMKWYYGVGTDFSFLFFLNVPLIYNYKITPGSPTT